METTSSSTMHGNVTQATSSGNLTMNFADSTNPRLVNGVLNLLFMLFNIAGNSLVFYVYTTLTKNRVFALFVRVMAALDLLTALTTMLIDVMMKLRDNDEAKLNLNVMCKLSHFQVYANSLASGCVLTLIAYQRYCKICQPLKPSMTLRKAKIVLAVIGVCCLVACVPNIIVYGKMDIDVLVGKRVVRTTICRYDETHKGSPLQLITSYLLLFAFSVVLLITVVLYVMVSRAIRSFERRNSGLTSQYPTSPTSPTTSQSAKEITAVNAQWDLRAGTGTGTGPAHRGQPLVTSPVHGRPGRVVIPPGTRAAEPVAAQPVAAQPVAAHTVAAHPVPARHVTAPNRNRLSQARASIFSVATSNHVSAQMYRMFAIITCVFIVSYLPHLVVLILTKTLDLDHTLLTSGQRMAMEFAYNCPYISTVSNPLVYGFSSSEFRDQLRELFYCDYACCRTSSSSSRNNLRRYRKR